MAYGCKVCWREEAPVSGGLCHACVEETLENLKYQANARFIRRSESETATLRLTDSFKAQLRLASMQAGIKRDR